MRRLAATFLCMTMVGCQTAPTKLGVGQQRREFELLIDKTQRPIEITDKTVVLDARSSFDFGLNRVGNSVHFPWDRLSETTAGGELPKDPRAAVRRLSLQGLTPETPVVVVGYGPTGKGEEGRLAWSLLYYGFRDVQTATVDTFRRNLTARESANRENAPPFQVEPRDALQMDRATFRQLSRDPKGRLAKRIFIIDVRSNAEYFNKAGGPHTPDIHAINMEWKEFFTGSGRPNPGVRAKLAAVGATPADQIVLVSNKGVRSGAAAYALLALGFAKVVNFTAGWNSLATDRL